MAFQEINPSIWTYEKDGDLIEGYLVRVQEDVGENKSKLYTIDTGNGFKSIWGSAILDERMVVVKVGSKIRITFKGLGQPKGTKQAPKIFKVEIDKEASL